MAIIDDTSYPEMRISLEQSGEEVRVMGTSKDGAKKVLMSISEAGVRMASCASSVGWETDTYGHLIVTNLGNVWNGQGKKS